MLILKTRKRVIIHILRFHYMLEKLMVPLLAHADILQGFFCFKEDMQCQMY